MSLAAIPHFLKRIRVRVSNRTGLSDPVVRWRLAAILVVGLGLRLWGITWGLPHPDLPRTPDHYDEYISMRTLGQINRHAGDLNPEGAHLCGTLVFFGWHVLAEGLNAVGILDQLPCYFEGLGDPDYRKMAIAGRLLIVAVDMTTLFLLFLLARGLAGKSEPGLWASAFYSILPFQVIHTHFMRPHVVGNLYVVLMLIMAVLLSRRPLKLSYHLATGLFLGMAMASLYQLFTLAIIPYFAYLGARIPREQPGVAFKPWLGIVANWRLFALAGMAFTMFFVGDPYLFLEWEAVRPFIESQSNATDGGQFAWGMLLNLSKTWPYLVNALPLSLFTLVIPAYASMVYLLFRRRFHVVALPTIFFSVLYTYYATKGYGLFAARALLYLFPIFALFSGVLLWESRKWASRSIAWTGVFWSTTGILFFSTFFYTFGYVNSMGNQLTNPYRQVYEHFDGVEAEEPLRVGFIGWEWDRYHVFNFGEILNTTRNDAVVTGSGIDYLDPAHRVDYLLVFNFDSTMHERVDALSDTLRADPTYYYVKTFSRPFQLGPLEMDLSRAPTDFRYPFPVIHLFARHED